jgi:hypothetical protein
MQITNTILQPGNQSSGASNQERTPRADLVQRIEAPAKEKVSNAVNSQELIRKGELRQLDRLQSAASLEKSDFKTQQAISEYQNTYEASQELEGGTLVGIDLYV